MTYPTAFSIELGETITASLANRLSFTGELTDSRAFICDGHDDCNAPLTCANFKTTKNERKNNPYFTEGARKANNHSESCSYLVKKSNSSNTNKETSSQVKQSKKLKLILGKDGFKKPQPRKQTHNTLSPQSNSSLTATYSVNSNGDKERKYSKSHVKTLRTLVEVFQSGEYDLDNTKLETLDSLSLNELFHSLDTPSTLSYQFRVYFGQAKIFEKDPDKPYYIVEFTKAHNYSNPTENGDIEDYPSFAVSKYQIHKNYPWSKQYINSTDTFTCFVSWFPTTNKGKKKTFINFEKVTPENYLFQK